MSTLALTIIAEGKEMAFWRYICFDSLSVSNTKWIPREKKSPRLGAEGEEAIERTKGFVRPWSFSGGVYTRCTVALHQLGSNEFGDKWPEIPANM